MTLFGKKHPLGVFCLTGQAFLYRMLFWAVYEEDPTMRSLVFCGGTILMIAGVVEAVSSTSDLKIVAIGIVAILVGIVFIALSLKRKIVK
jgi:hypothetical protein